MDLLPAIYHNEKGEIIGGIARVSVAEEPDREFPWEREFSDLRGNKREKPRTLM